MLRRLACVLGLCLCLSAYAKDEGVTVRTVGPGGGGYLVSMCASRHHTNRLYVGCDVGGFYRSDDRGRNYTILNAGIDNLFVWSIAEHPTERETLIIGTKGGVCKSRDGGRHWSWRRDGAKGLGPKEMYRNTWEVSQVSWCERNPKRVWAAACESKDVSMSQIWRSDDEGENWRLVNGKDDPLGAERKRIISLSANPSVADELLATTATGLFLSEDGGANWRRIEAGLPSDGVMDFGCVGRCNARPNVVYLSMRERVGKEGWKHPCQSAVFRSEDGGRTWIKRGTPPIRPDAGKSPCPYWNEPVMVVNPINPDEIWTGGSTFFYDSIWKSADGGLTWAKNFKGPTQGWLHFWGNGAARPITVSLSDPKFVAYGTSGTIYATEDGGVAWHQRYTGAESNENKFCGSGLEVTCLRFAQADSEKKKRWYLGYWDLGLMVTDDGGRSLRRCVEGIPADRRNSCFAMAQSPDNGDVLWASFGDWAGAKIGSIFAVSRDRGEHWEVKTNGWACGIADSVAAVKVGGKCVLAAASPGAWNKPHSFKGLQISDDGGDSWRTVSTNLFPNAGTVCHVAASDNVFYACTMPVGSKVNGAIWSSADGGKNWARITPAGMKMANVVQMAFRGDAIAVAANDAHHAKNGGGCFVSRNRGKDWEKVYSAPCCRAVAFVGKVLAMATTPVGWRDPGFCGDGVMLSRDLGRTWTHAVGDGVDKPTTTKLAASDLNPGELWCCTGGNSILVLGVKEEEDVPPVMMLRYRGTQMDRQEIIDGTVKQLKANLGAADDVWFSTGIGYPPLSWHRENSAKIAKAAKQLAEVGISASLQLQSSLGHGDSISSTYDCSSKNWCGFTGEDGVEAKYCSCPRQKGMIAYFQEVGKIYAEWKPKCIWVDDDLRLSNHSPVKSGCWCGQCVGDFAKEEGKEWTRETLSKACKSDGKLAARWLDFRRRSLAEFATAFGDAVHKVSPKTALGFQHNATEARNFQLFRAMAKSTGLPVGSRPGGGAYEDHDPRGLLDKAYFCGGQLKIMEPLDCLGTICPEVENYPRAYGSKTPRGTCVEALLHLTQGMNSLSLFVADADLETPEWYGENFYSRLAAARPIFSDYVHATKGALPAGFAYPGFVGGLMKTPKFELLSLGLPVVTATGKTQGVILDGSLASALPKEELEKALSSPALILDGQGAAALVKRGYGELLGGLASVSSGEKLPGFAEANGRRNETYTDDPLNRGCGVRHATYKQAGYLVKFSNAKTRALGRYLDNSGKPVGDGTVLAQLKDGRRLAVLGCAGFDGTSVSSGRLLQLQRIADWVTGGTLPIVLDTPALACTSAQVNPDGTLAAVAIVNVTIDRMKPLSIRLRGLADGVREMKWQSFDEKPVMLPVERVGDEARVKLPMLSAWNGGILIRD